MTTPPGLGGLNWLKKPVFLPFCYILSELSGILGDAFLGALKKGSCMTGVIKCLLR